MTSGVSRHTPVTQDPPHGHDERGLCEACMKIGQQDYAHYLRRVAAAARDSLDPAKRTPQSKELRRG